MVGEGRPGLLTAVWWVTGCWVAVRAGVGMLRVWPGIGNSPLNGSTSGQTAPVRKVGRITLPHENCE
ncbi:MAG TPA: hypothetical protein VLT88_16440, partial [Desulfosarcina sp.]|nr:hypothetical protein [Desulfosarcina sp.]